MQILNSELASTLQYVTFPLEVIGLTLATIEVRFAALTSRINAYLENQVEKWTLAREEIKRRHPYIYKLYGGNSRLHIPMPALLYHMLTVLAVVIIVAAVTHLAARALNHVALIDQEALDAVGRFYDVFAMWVYLPVSLLTITALGVVFVAVKFVANRAVGTLGIIIAGVGVLGEAYQVLVQLNS